MASYRRWPTGWTPRCATCIERNTHGTLDEKPMTKDVATALCKRLRAEGAL